MGLLDVLQNVIEIVASKIMAGKNQQANAMHESSACMQVGLVYSDSVCLPPEFTNAEVLPDYAHDARVQLRLINNPN